MGRAFVFVVFLIGFVIFTVIKITSECFSKGNAILNTDIFTLIKMVIKMVLAGTTAAYEAVFDPNAKDEKINEAVFDPNAKDEKIKAVVAKCFMKVNVIMKEKYSKQFSQNSPGHDFIYMNIGFRKAQLCNAILHLTPMVQSIILEHGYQANTEIAKDIVCHAILLGGHASDEEIDSAIRRA